MQTILLIEDALDLAKALRQDMQAAGFEVLHAADGLRALELHAVHQPDLVILDWMLPGLDGLEVLRQIRQHAATPVIMLTARTEELDRIEGLEVGADDYITKPFSTPELIARVKAVLRRIELVEETIQQDKQPADDTIITCGDLQLNPAHHQVLLNNTELTLSRIEFDLLHLLLRNPGRVFSRAYLLETVWDVEATGSDRAVDNAILRLRKKLGDMGETIETVWGVGYRLRDAF
jgi:DNA-binding response OmpR family regulator